MLQKRQFHQSSHQLLANQNQYLHQSHLQWKNNRHSLRWVGPTHTHRGTQRRRTASESPQKFEVIRRFGRTFHRSITTHPVPINRKLLENCCRLCRLDPNRFPALQATALALHLSWIIPNHRLVQAQQQLTIAVAVVLSSTEHRAKSVPFWIKDSPVRDRPVSLHSGRTAVRIE